MERTVIALVRHGHYVQGDGVPSAHLPHPLTELGREQAADCVRTLLEFAWAEGLTPQSRVTSSSLLRAFETASIVARGLQKQLERPFAVHTFDDLAERSVGAAANLSVSEIEAVLKADPRYEVPSPGWKSRSGFKLPFIGAESLLDAGRRVATRLDAIAEAGLSVVVSHGGALRHAAHHLGLLSIEDVAGLSMWHCSPVFIERTTDGWRHLAGDWKVRTTS